MHKYLYAANDPVNKIDPNGEEGIIQQGFAMAMQGIMRAINFVNYSAIRIAIWANLAVGIVKSRLHHILSAHSLLTRAEQVPYILTRYGRSAADAFIRVNTYFPKDWSENQINAAVTTVYRLALRSGVSNGQYQAIVNGETVVVALKDGILRTAYGLRVYGLSDLGF